MSPAGGASAQPWIDTPARSRARPAPRRAEELERALRSEVILDLAGLDPPRGFEGIGRPRLLDVGCRDASWLAHVLPYAAPFGIDRAVGLLAEDRHRVARARYTGATATALPFASHAFDIVTIVDALERLSPVQEAGAIREARRVLRPGGRIVIVAATDLRTLPWRLAPRYGPRQFARLFDDFTDVRLAGLVPHLPLLRMWMSAPIVWRLFTPRVRVCGPHEAEILVGVGVKR